VIDDIDGERRILTLIGTAGTFIFRDGVVELSLSEPRLTELRDIRARKIRKKRNPGRIHRIFLSLRDIFVARILDNPKFLLPESRFDVYSPRYLHESKWQIFGLSRLYVAREFNAILYGGIIEVLLVYS
jgi:hypothetical protein